MTNVWTITRGETGATRTGTLSDSDGPVDLSQFDTVSVIASRSPTTVPIIDDFVTIDPDQTANRGDFSFSFTEAQAGIQARTYLLQFKALSGGEPTYFPLNRRSEQTYGKLVVVEPLD